MTDITSKAMCEDYGTSACHIATDEIGEEVCMCAAARQRRAGILDSGNRTKFSTGAVRDVQQGKGRFDLMPLDIVAGVFYSVEKTKRNGGAAIGDVIDRIGLFKASGYSSALIDAIVDFAFAREIAMPELMLDVSQHFENGALKYGERNWEKGIPISRYIDSGLRHLMKVLRGDMDEDHAAAFIWNCMCAAWTMEHLPEMDDYTLARKNCF